jgi:carbonic anhydrase/acetyltransferase-like protein (isoleucine patch superfamily)
MTGAARCLGSPKGWAACVARVSRLGSERAPVTGLRSDQHRTDLGFLTVAGTDALTDSGVRVLDPFSALISAGVVIGPDTVIYPGVVIQQDAAGRLELGARNVLYPGTILLARQGASLVIGDECELGPGGVQVKANQPGSDITVGNGVRLLNGCELTGRSELGDGCQIIGAVQAQSVRLAGGLGGYQWPEPDERGALLKGTGLARGIVLERGEVISCQPSFADAEVARQSSFHPASRPASGSCRR